MMEIELMIAKFKEILNKMDHSNLVASKRIGDQHRILNNMHRLANYEEKLDLEYLENVLEQSRKLHRQYNEGVLTSEYI